MGKSKYAHLDKILAENEGWTGTSRFRDGVSRERLTPGQREVMDYLSSNGFTPQDCADGNYIPPEVYAAIMGDEG